MQLPGRLMLHVIQTPRAPPDLALRPLGSRVLDPQPQRGRRQIELARDGADGLAFVEDQSNSTFFELI